MNLEKEEINKRMKGKIMNLMNLPGPRKDELKMMAMRLNWWMWMMSQGITDVFGSSLNWSTQQKFNKVKITSGQVHKF